MESSRLAAVLSHGEGPRRAVTTTAQLLRASRNRLLPAEGFSLDELLAAGVSLAQAEGWGLPVDLLRVDACEPNVAALRVYARASRVTPG